MPVQTRSQLKKLANAKSNNLVNSSENIQKGEPGPNTEKWFIDFIKRRINHHDFDLHDKEDKIRSTYEIMYIVSEYLPDILRNNPNRWGRFAKVVYNKIYEYEYETDFTSFDKDMKDDFISFIHHLRAHLLELFKELNIEIEFDNKNLHMDTGMVNVYPPLDPYYCVKIFIR